MMLDLTQSVDKGRSSHEGVKSWGQLSLYRIPCSLDYIMFFTYE